MPGDEHVDDLPELVDRTVRHSATGPPPSGRAHRPASDRQRHADRAGPPRRAGRCSEAPPVDGDMVHLDTALGEQFLDVAVGQPKAQVPADRQDDDVGWEAEASEGRSCSGSRARAARSHAISLAAQAWPSERNSPLWVIRCSQLPPQRSARLLSTTLSRVCSGAGLRRLSLSRARSSAEMRHRRRPSRGHPT
jgi:hypothetical protein